MYMYMCISSRPRVRARARVRMRVRMRVRVRVVRGTCIAEWRTLASASRACTATLQVNSTSTVSPTTLMFLRVSGKRSAATAQPSAAAARAMVASLAISAISASDPGLVPALKTTLPSLRCAQVYIYDHVAQPEGNGRKIGGRNRHAGCVKPDTHGPRSGWVAVPAARLSD